MELSPGYKQTEVGVIPEDWALAPAGDFMNFQNGYNTEKAAYGDGLRFINVLEVLNHSHLSADEINGRVRVSPSTTASYGVHAGDILFNRTSETQHEIGLATVYEDDEVVIFGGFVIRAQLLTGILDQHYSGFGLRAPLVRSQIIARGQGHSGQHRSE